MLRRGMTLLVGLLLVVLLSVGSEAEDPCTMRPEDVFVVEHHPENATRSTNVTSRPGDKLHCDRSLVEGWYIFLAPDSPNGNRKSLTMANECVPNYRCGTRYTLWMNGEIPNPGEISNTHCCVSVKNKCCAFRLELQVKNCGNDIIAYYLLPSPGCPSGYCFGDHSPCPQGQGSPTGFTPGCLPSEVVELVNDPVLLLENQVDPNLQEIRYACTLEPNKDHDARQSFEVSWLMEQGDGTKELLRDVKDGDLPIKFTLGEDKLENSVFGKYIQCKIRSFFRRGAYSQWKVSQERLFVGIEILGYTNRRIELNEGEDYNIQLKVHTPYLGDAPLDLEVRVPFGARDGAHCSTGEPLAQLVYGDCAIKISKDDWLNKKIVTARVRASLDNKIETGTEFGKGNVLRTVYLRTPDIVFGHPVWSNYHLPSIEILVKDKDEDVAVCRSTNDPHMKTFDGVTYELQTEGYFLLYRHKTQPFEVHAHFKSCNGNGRAPYCNCAVGILAVSDVIMFDKCSRGVIDMTAWGPGQTRLRIAARGPCSVRRGTRILQENGGKRYVVQLQSGTSVIVEDSYRKFINLYIEASQSDFGQTEGLCGLFDQNCANDLIPKDHRTLPNGYSRNCGSARPLHPDVFRESWRLAKTQTILHWNAELFDKDQRITTFDGHVFCTCAKDNPDIDIDCKAGGDVPKCKPKRTQRDVADKKFQSCRKRRETSFHDHYDFLDYDESEYNLVAQPREEDLEGISSNHYSPRYKRAQPYTEDTAREFCRTFIFRTTAGQKCSELNVDTQSPIEACVLDLLATNDENWAVAALDTVKQQCMAELDKNTTRWIQPSNEANYTIPPPEIEGAICFNECSNNGLCVNGTCECFSGFSAPDCSINVTAIPLLLYTPMCDLKTRPCRTNPVIGNGFLEDLNITCHFYEYTIGSDGLTSVSNVSINQPAEFENYAEVTCRLPSPDQLTASRLPHEPIAYKVHVSNDGKRKSRYGVLIIFNSACFNCDLNATSCFEKMNSCVINGSCYRNGEQSPRDRCNICLPDLSRSSWSPRKSEGCQTTSASATTLRPREPTRQEFTTEKKLKETTTLSPDVRQHGGFEGWKIGIIVGVSVAVVLTLLIISLVVWSRKKRGRVNMSKTTEKTETEECETKQL